MSDERAHFIKMDQPFSVYGLFYSFYNLLDHYATNKKKKIHKTLHCNNNKTLCCSCTRYIRDFQTRDRENQKYIGELRKWKTFGL